MSPFYPQGVSLTILLASHEFQTIETGVAYQLYTIFIAEVAILTPLLQLTKQECYQLMSPVLMALLPKLHLNRHTSRAIINGPEEFGGLALPHLHTLKGVDKLKLNSGNLRLQDRTGHLIHIDIGYVQLLTGASTLFMNQEPAKYEWVESGWLTSLWEFISRSKLTITYPLS